MESNTTEKRPKITIILLNYNNYSDTYKCVDSLKQVNYPNYEILIVDNRSTNDSITKLKEIESPTVHIVDSGKNGGFAYGNNVGIKLALENGADYILLLNNDTLVEPDFLTAMVKTAENSAQIGITTCRIMYDSERTKVWYAGGIVDWKNARAIHCYMDQHAPEKEKIHDVTFVSGCCMMISKECANRVGDMPEDYFMYYEDLDYCVRIADLGLRLVYVPDSVIYHCVSASSGGSESPFVVEWMSRSRRRFMKRYHSKYSLLMYLFVYIKCELRTVARIVCGNRRKERLIAYVKSFTR